MMKAKWIPKIAIILTLTMVPVAVCADENIRDAQQILNILGYDAGPVDGAWGKRTNAALAQYANENGIIYDGILTSEFHDTLVSTNPGLTTGKRYLEKALSLSHPEMFPIGNKECYGLAKSATPYYYRTVNRKVFGNKRIGGFIDDVAFIIAEHLGDKARETHQFTSGKTAENYRTFVQHLIEAANKKAFTKLNFTKGGGANPAHWVSALLHNLAYFVNYSDRERLWTTGQRKTIVTWGNQLYSTSLRVSGPGSGRINNAHRWPDTAGLQSLSKISWGIAAKNLHVLEDGVSEWFDLHRLIQSDGAMKTFLNGGRWQNVGGRKNNDFYYDNTLGFMVIAASAAQSIGIDLFKQVTNGATLHDAVRWKVLYSTDWKKLPKIRIQPLYDRYNGRRRYWQPSSFGGNWGWTEAYLSTFQDGKESQIIRAQIKRFVGFKKYHSTTMGPMSCLYGAHR